jgi:hypothetical protein
MCAYLRTPFQPPGSPLPPLRRGIRRPLVPAASAARRGTSDAPLPVSGAGREDDARQEREVRLAAQRLLAAHLRQGEDWRHPVNTFWHNIDLDLSGATLIDFRLADVEVRTARFDGAIFVGSTDFADTRFTGEAGFAGARFAGTANFATALFAAPPRFGSSARSRLPGRISGEPAGPIRLPGWRWIWTVQASSRSTLWWTSVARASTDWLG